MESKRTILKRNMNKAYCSGTRFEYLDEDERPLIYKAMQEYAEKYHAYQCALAENTPTSSEQLATPAVVGRSEQLPCNHVEKLMQGDGFVYAICALCGEDI
jgi:hypothetical protein